MEIEMLQDKKNTLESKLESLEEEKQIEALESQVNLLQSLLKDKEMLSNDLSPNDFEAIKHSLNILSEKKKKDISTKRINKEARKKASKYLFLADNDDDYSIGTAVSDKQPSEGETVGTTFPSMRLVAENVNNNLDIVVDGDFSNENSVDMVLAINIKRKLRSLI